MGSRRRSYEDDANGIPDLSGAPDGQRATGDPVDEQMPPAEFPRASEAWGTTAAEQRAGEGLDGRLAAEEDERARGERDDEAGLLSDDGDPDAEPDLIAHSGGPNPSPSAEEAAMHVRREAPGGVDRPDSYVDRG
jgi:hypothetical protein